MKYEPKPNAFSIPVRVYYEDTDAGGVVYYANYLKFFERCRTEWMRFAGHDQSQLATDAGIGFVARKASCEYLKPARLDDELSVGLEVEKLTRVRVIFRQHVRRGDIVAVHALRRGSAEVVEIIVHGDFKTSRVVGRRLEEINLPPGASICAVLRDGVLQLVSANLVIAANDHVVVFVTDKRYVPAVEKLFQVGIHFF